MGWGERTVTTFEKVKWSRTVHVDCPGCGKRRKVQRTFHQTINPYNKNSDGFPKTYSEVLASVKDEAYKWTPSKDYELYHERCRYLAPFGLEAK